MTISDSELRRNAAYEDISATSFAPAEPDTANFSIAIRSVEDLVELECDCTGTKSVFIYDEQARRTLVDITGPIFGSWSDDLKRKITELLSDLAQWESSMRKPRSAWDIRLLADPDRSLDEIPEGEDIT